MGKIKNGVQGLIDGMIGVSGENLRTLGQQGHTVQRRLEQDLFLQLNSENSPC